MTLINVCLAVVAFGLLWPVIVFAIGCASMGRLAEPFPVGEWYGQTLPPLADTRPAVILPETVEAELRKLAAMIPDRPA